MSRKFDGCNDFDSLKSGFEMLLSICLYRLPMIVNEIHVYDWKAAFPCCPRCKTTMEREYQYFCDRCGQRLSWDKYEDSDIEYIGWDDSVEDA